MLHHVSVNDRSQAAGTFMEKASAACTYCWKALAACRSKETEAACGASCRSIRVCCATMAPMLMEGPADFQRTWDLSGQRPVCPEQQGHQSMQVLMHGTQSIALLMQQPVSCLYQGAGPLQRAGSHAPDSRPEGQCHYGMAA